MWGMGPALKMEGQAKGSAFQVLLPGEVLAVKVPGCFGTIQISQITNGPLPDDISAANSAGDLNHVPVRQLAVQDEIGDWGCSRSCSKPKSSGLAPLKQRVIQGN